jgi:hypothetical protein
VGLSDGSSATSGTGPRVMPLESGRRAALIVATAHYGDSELQQLRAPVADAEQFAAVLERPDVAAFDVNTVIDEPARVIARELQRFLSGRSHDDLLLVYFSCHGLKDLDGSLYFAGTDTEMALPWGVTRHNFGRDDESYPAAPRPLGRLDP